MENRSPGMKEHKSITKHMVFGALCGALAALFQSAGGWLPGLGLAISPLATAPIALSTFVQYRTGVLAFILSNILLLFLQPSELMIFPFTTGLLGIGLGYSFNKCETVVAKVICSSLFLTLGIIFVLYVLQFPILGPMVKTDLSIFTLFFISIFSLGYSWLWLILFQFILVRIYVKFDHKSSL